jgi:hypothetical protein
MLILTDLDAFRERVLDLVRKFEKDKSHYLYERLS